MHMQSPPGAFVSWFLGGGGLKIQGDFSSVCLRKKIYIRSIEGGSFWARSNQPRLGCGHSFQDDEADPDYGIIATLQKLEQPG